jgi:hypothetical protein
LFKEELIFEVACYFIGEKVPFPLQLQAIREAITVCSQR